MPLKPSNKGEKILSGKWDDNTSWEFYVSKKMPPKDLCTAVFCIASYKGKIILTRNHRGWEILGGHIEKGETVKEALRREAWEEGGVVVDKCKLIGFRKIISKKKVESGRDFEYPFPVSYIPHFIVLSQSEPKECTAEECFERGLFTIEEIKKMNLKDYPMIEASLPFFKSFGG